MNDSILDTDESKLFKKINSLPEVLIVMIKEYVPLNTFIFTNRTYYLNYHYLLKNQILHQFSSNIPLLGTEMNGLEPLLCASWMRKGVKKSLQNSKCIENYIRTMIRRDFDFVFEQIIKENYIQWLNHKKYIYKNTKYANYIYFLIDYCIENESDKCRFVLVNFLKEHDLCQNHIKKKNTSIHIRWKT